MNKIYLNLEKALDIKIPRMHLMRLESIQFLYLDVEREKYLNFNAIKFYFY